MNNFLNEINKNGYIILDDFLSPKSMDYINRICTLSEIYNAGDLQETVNKEAVSVYFSNGTPLLEPVYESLQMVSIIHGEDGRILKREIYDTIQIIISRIQEVFNYEITFEPIRYKINLQPQVNRPPHKLYNTPHTDHATLINNHYYSIIYYINDSDGDTFIFNEKYNGSQLNNLTVNTRISPKKGRCIIFPYNTLHAGNHPIKSKIRLVINLNVRINFL